MGDTSLFFFGLFATVLVVAGIVINIIEFRKL